MREVVGSTLLMAGLTVMVIGAVFRTGIGVWVMVIPGVLLTAAGYLTLHRFGSRPTT